MTERAQTCGQRRGVTLAIAAGLSALLLGSARTGDTSASKRAPAFTREGRLVRPTDYRDWAFATSGLGMTYGPGHSEPNPNPFFDNVFVSREAYRQFMRSGKWPEKTMFILEIRKSETKVSINNGGRTQGEIVALEASVKDTKRFGGEGWGYFTFDSDKGLTDDAAPLPRTASCYPCHRDKTAVDNTFVQFYPTLLDAAKRHGTLRPGYERTDAP